MTSIGHKIRELRRQRGMTQHELAAGLVTPSMISQIESDRAKPSQNLLAALADRLGMPPDYFATEQDDSPHALEAALLRAEYLLRLNKPDDAKAVLENIDRPEHPGNSQFTWYLLMARAFRLNKDFAAAVDMVERLREAGYRHRDSLWLFRVGAESGQLEYDTERLENAIHEWERAIPRGELALQYEIERQGAIRGEVTAVCLKLYKAYQKQGNLEKASIVIQRCLPWASVDLSLASIADHIAETAGILLAGEQPGPARQRYEQAVLLRDVADRVQHAIQVASIVSAEQGQSTLHPHDLAAHAIIIPTLREYIRFEVQETAKLIEQGQVDGARARMERLESIPKDDLTVGVLRELLPFMNEAKAHLAELQGDLESARRYLEDAIEVAREVSAPRECIGLCLALVRLFARQGNLQEANHWMTIMTDEVRAHMPQIGAHPDNLF